MKSDLKQKIKTILTISVVLILATDVVVFHTLVNFPVSGSVILQNVDNKGQSCKYAPVPVIEGVDSDIIDVFNNQVFHLNASKSYSENGKIVEFVWQIGEKIFYGESIAFRVSENIDSLLPDRLPLIYLSLTVRDEKGCTGMRGIILRVLPDKLYLSKEGLSVTKSNEIDKISIKPFGGKDLIYKLPESIEFPPCEFKLSMKIRRSPFSRISKVELYGLTEAEEIIKLGEGKSFRKSGAIEVRGRIESRVKLAGFCIKIKGFSIGGIKIMYDDTYIQFHNLEES